MKSPIARDAEADPVKDVVMSEQTGRETPRIKVSKNGPYLVNGEVEYVDADGNIVETRAKAALCRCGQSSTKPWCDGSHRAAGFEAEDFQA